MSGEGSNVVRLEVGREHEHSFDRFSHVSWQPPFARDVIRCWCGEWRYGQPYYYGWPGDPVLARDGAVLDDGAPSRASTGFNASPMATGAGARQLARRGDGVRHSGGGESLEPAPPCTGSPRLSLVLADSGVSLHRAAANPRCAPLSASTSLPILPWAGAPPLLVRLTAWLVLAAAVFAWFYLISLYVGGGL